MKLKNVRSLDSWNIATDDQLKTLLERISLSDYEKKQIKDFIARTNAFKVEKVTLEVSDDIPF